MKRIFLFVMAAVFLSGCGLFHKETEKTATELITEARTEFEDKDYLDAIKLFEQLRNWYPFSEHVKEAQIKIGDAYFELKKYDEAIRAYKLFERLYPLHPEAEKASFRIAESYYKQILSIDRDQTYTEEALNHFIKFIQSYPDSQLVKKAKKHSKDCIERLAKSELYVADFYLKQKSFDSAIARYENIIKFYPDSHSAVKAVKKIESAKILQKKAMDKEK
ncbi:MAG: outer membrane protein assembly factor BamD [Desulforegulaceae bacterium]|nr:outer membrane protein assembly factor BamD [Desulforegulaceae bacterium]